MWMLLRQSRLGRVARRVDVVGENVDSQDEREEGVEDSDPANDGPDL